MAVPERHLGLHMPGDDDVPANLPGALAELVAAHIDLDALLALAATAQLPAAEQTVEEGSRAAAEAAAPAPAPGGSPVRIAVARDAAFCFYYQDNLALLQAAGAQLMPFSPMADPLPADVAGVYLGGGYPERCVLAVQCTSAGGT